MRGCVRVLRRGAVMSAADKGRMAANVIGLPIAAATIACPPLAIITLPLMIGISAFAKAKYKAAKADREAFERANGYAVED